MRSYRRTLVRPLARRVLASYKKMPKGYALRLAELDDIDSILEIAKICFSTDLPTRRSMRNFLTGAHALIFLVLDKKGEIIGYHHLEANARNKILYINAIAFLSAHRGKGLGKAFYDLTEILARQGRFSVIRFHVSNKNPASLRLAQSCGYAPLKLERAYLEDGSDSYLMQKKVGL